VERGKNLVLGEETRIAKSSIASGAVRF
jgi:hypothetical protein